MKKRLLAMLLALMLVVGLLPVGVLAAAGDVLENLDGVQILEGVPTQYVPGLQRPKDSITLDVGEKGSVQSLPNMVIYGAKCGHFLLQSIPTYYTIKGYEVTQDGIISDGSFTLGYYNTPGELSGYPAIQFEFNATGAGTTQVTIGYYYNFDERGGSYSCGTCGMPTYVPANLNWYYDTVTFQVTVDESDVPNPPPEEDALTVTKALSGVVRDGEALDEVSEDTVLYIGDQVTWDIVVANNTDAAVECSVSDSAGYYYVASVNGLYEPVPYANDPDIELTLNGMKLTNKTITVPANSSVTLKASCTVAGLPSDIEGTKLVNTVTVTAGDEEFTDDASNPVGYTLTVTYNGNGGKYNMVPGMDEQEREVTVRVPEIPGEYTVEDDAFGFTLDGYEFAGWYTDDEDGTEVTGKAEELSGDATYFAHWTETEASEPDLSVAKSVVIPDGKETASVGDVLGYTITITNAGGAATGVTVTDSMWSSNGSVLVGETLTNIVDGSVKVDVPANGSVEIYYTHTVQGNEAGTTLKNTVTVGDLSDSTSTPVAEAEEPANQAVRVYAIKNMDKNTAVLIGSAMAAMGDNVFDVLRGIEINYAPAGFENYERTDDLFRKDNLDIAFTEDDVINGWTNVYVNYIGKEQTVNVVIYRNGDTTTPYATHSLGEGIRFGDVYDLTGLDINDYYQTQPGSIRFDFEGWYNDGGWNSYKAGNPNNTLGDSITINGWTNIICMVWDVERVNVQAVVDGDKDAAETIFTGEARRGTNLIDYLNAHTSEMTDYDRVGYIRDQWYNRDWYGHKFADDSTVNGWTNVYVTYTSDWQTVQVVIYRNGDTTTRYATIPLDNMRKGETLKISDLKDINEYYTPDKFATGFVYEGWFNDGAWNNYVKAGCPEDAEGLDEIYINGWTNVIAMVWDQFPVNYHVLDESGAEVDSNNEVRTARDLNDDFWWPEVDAGYAFDGWYEKAEDIGNESKQEGLPLGLKKYELYGELVSLAPEEGPNEDDLAKLKVRVNDNKNAPVNHGGKNLDLIEGCYDIGKIVEKDGIYTVTVTPIVAEYAKQYDIAQGFAEGSHTATTTQGKVNFVFTWTDGEWVLTSDDSVTIGVKCSVTVPTPDELAELLQIRVKDYAGAEELPVGVTDHGQFVTGILEGTYSITGPTAENNTFVATVTLTDGSAYAAAYDENRQLEAGTHALTTTVSKLDPITLTYDFTTGTWSASNTGWSLGVKCEQVIYTIHVSFVGPNGEAYGGGDVISTMPDVSVEIADPVAEGKTFVGWKKLVGLEEIYTGEFTYTALAALVGDNFTPDTHETWLEFEAVFEDETVEPDPYNTIHVSFVGPNGEAYGGGDVISTMPDVSVEIADPVAEGKTFVGWKKLVGLEEIYNGEFTYTALAALVGDNFTPDTHEAWLTFEAVFEDETVEPDPYYIINIRFVDSDGTTSLGGGDVISTSPDAAYPSVPSPVAPQGMEFVGWKVWLGNEPMYEGKFTYNALKALREELDGEITWVDGRTWITFQAVYEDVTVEPDPDITDFSKTLLTDRDAYNFFDIAYPEFYHGDVVVDEGEGVTLIYRIVVEGTPGTAYTISDPGARLISNGSWTGTIDADGRVSILVAKTFSWRDVRNAGDTLDNTASVSVDGETVKTDTERVPVDIDWDINVPDIDDDDDDDVAEPDDEYIPNWLNTTDHYSYIVGYEDGTIRPGNNITRAEVATIFYRLLSEGSSERWYSASNSFSDVAADSWYNVPVSTLSNMGIIDGYEDGTFKPNAPITRAEFTAIATRFFDYTAEYEGAFNDVTYSDWYADCVQAAVDMGLVNGYADGGFHPNAYITRAESCAIVNRVLNRVPHEDYLLDEDEMITWPDNSYGAWYYADMQEATNSHDYDWISVSGEVVEEWTDKLAEPNW